LSVIAAAPETDEATGPDGGAPVAPARRSVARTARALAPWALLTLPVAGYFLFIKLYGVNTIVLDQWADVALLKQLYAGHLTFSALWAPHNENRMLFPNLVMLALASLTHLNTVVEMYLSAVLVLVATFLLIGAHRRRAPGTPLWRYLPVVALMFCLSQYSGTLLGFELNWYMCLLAVAAVTALLDREASWVSLTWAVVISVVGSFSGIEGLLAWPAGLVLLVLRRRGLKTAGAWATAAALTTIVYFHNLAMPPAAFSRYGFDNPIVGIKFALVAIGDVLGYSLPYGSGATTTADLLFAVGLIVVLVSLASVLWVVVRRPDDGPAPIGAALVVAGLLFAMATAAGRSFFGTWAADQSRFVTFDVFPLIGTYLVWLSSREAARRAAGGPVVEPTPAASAGVGRRRTSQAVAAAGFAIALVPAVFGVYHGVQGGRSTLVYDHDAGDVTVNIDNAPNGLVEGVLYPFTPPSYVRGLVPTVRSHHLSLYDTSQVAQYERLGLVFGRPVAAGK
jgi:hypothetical protein